MRLSALKLDSNDLSILKVLMEDGRASLREIAARTSLSTPTVSFRLSRMQKSGLIRGFAPILDPSATNQVLALVKLKVAGHKMDGITRVLAKMPEVTGVYVTTGEDNLTVKVSTDDVESLQRFVGGKLAKLPDVELVSNNIITKTLKDERSPRLKQDTTLKLRCDFCQGEVTSNRPYNIKVGSTYHYFCCRTCRKSYLDKYRSRIRSATSRLNR